MDFATTGARRVVAPRHLYAIEATWSQLLAALASADSAGVLDSYDLDVPFSRKQNGNAPEYALIAGVPGVWKESIDRHGHRLTAVGDIMQRPEWGSRYSKVEPGLVRSPDRDKDRLV